MVYSVRMDHIPDHFLFQVAIDFQNPMRDRIVRVGLAYAGRKGNGVYSIRIIQYTSRCGRNIAFAEHDGVFCFTHRTIVYGETELEIASVVR